MGRQVRCRLSFLTPHLWKLKCFFRTQGLAPEPPRTILAFQAHLWPWIGVDRTLLVGAEPKNPDYEAGLADLASKTKGATQMKLLPDSLKKDSRKDKKPSKRIPLRIPFRVTGTDENGFVFEEHAESVDVSTGGGCLRFMKDIKKGASLKLYSPKGGLFMVNVRWFRYDMRKNVRYFGFQLVEQGDRWVLTEGQTG